MFFVKKNGEDYEVFQEIRKGKDENVAVFFGGENLKGMIARTRAERLVEEENKIAMENGKTTDKKDN
jgi:hypothetical protein